MYFFLMFIMYFVWVFYDTLRIFTLYLCTSRRRNVHRTQPPGLPLRHTFRCRHSPPSTPCIIMTFDASSHASQSIEPTLRLLMMNCLYLLLPIISLSLCSFLRYPSGRYSRGIFLHNVVCYYYLLAHNTRRWGREIPHPRQSFMDILPVHTCSTYFYSLAHDNRNAMKLSQITQCDA